MGFGSNKIVKVRKEQQCFSCFRKFPKGTQMDSWSWCLDGDWNHGYTCETCVKIIDAHRYSEEFIDGVPEGYVLECLEQGQTPEEYLVEAIKEKQRLEVLRKSYHY